jgi:hypothetical protein
VTHHLEWRCHNWSPHRCESMAGTPANLFVSCPISPPQRGRITTHASDSANSGAYNIDSRHPLRLRWEQPGLGMLQRPWQHVQTCKPLDAVPAISSAVHLPIGQPHSSVYNQPTTVVLTKSHESLDPDTLRVPLAMPRQGTCETGAPGTPAYRAPECSVSSAPHVAARMVAPENPLSSIDVTAHAVLNKRSTPRHTGLVAHEPATGADRD